MSGIQFSTMPGGYTAEGQKEIIAMQGATAVMVKFLEKNYSYFTKRVRGTAVINYDEIKKFISEVKQELLNQSEATE